MVVHSIPRLPLSVIAFISGTLSGLSLYLDTNKSRRIMVALYLTTRSGYFAGRWIAIKLKEMWSIKRQQQKNNNKLNMTLTLKEVSSPSSPELQMISMNQDQNELNTVESDEISPMSSSSGKRFGTDIEGEMEDIEEEEEEIVISSNDTIKILDNHDTSINPSLIKEETKQKSSSVLVPVEKIKKKHRYRESIGKTIASVTIMAIASGQILYAYLLEPETLAVSIFLFIILFLFFSGSNSIF